MAEAMYGINPELISKAKTKIPKEFIEILDKAYKISVKDEIDR